MITARFTLFLMLASSLTACADYQQAAPVDAVEVHDVKGHH